MKNVEPTLNQIIAEVLDGMRRRWRVEPEKAGVFEKGQKRPDIIIRHEGRSPILIENEFMPARNAESDAAERLGQKIKNGGKVRAVIALRSPEKLKTMDFARLKKHAAAAEFEYALLVGENEKTYVRFPAAGWLTGGLDDLAGFAYRAAIPAEIIDGLVISVKDGINDAAGALRDLSPGNGAKIEKILQQKDGEQTRRMAMAIILNALIFHEAFAGQDGVRNIDETCKGGIGKRVFLDEWQKILDINYWPIFGVASELLVGLPEAKAQCVLPVLMESAKSLAAAAFSYPDVFGIVFQKLIADRKFLATFYTRPASAALLANLAIPRNAPFENGSWKKNAGDYIVADFACGTGALLSAAYQRIAELHERNGGDPMKLHARMMENAMIGCDVMPAGVHLTAAILAGAHPTGAFEETKIYVMPYGEPQKGEYRIGSLELLNKRSFLPVISTSAQKAGGHGSVKAATKEVLRDHPNLVIMNPPFTRPTKYVEGYVNPAFAAFSASAKLQKELGARNKWLRTGTCGSGNAGLASDFVALADKMVWQNGVTAFVLPLTVMAGESWDDVRELWTQHYDDICVVSLSAHRDDDCSFSADTGMAEILFVGRRTNGRDGGARKKPRATFVVLNRRPDNEMQGYEFARQIKTQLCGDIAKLDDGPVGGTPIFAGDARIGGMLDAPLPPASESPWCIARVRDLTLAQISHSLVGGLLWIPGQAKNKAAKIPMGRLGGFAKRGFIARDINEKPNRGAFDIHPIAADDRTIHDYPCLWSHNAGRETQLVIAPDSYGVVRKNKYERALEIWQTAGRAHFNMHFRFNSQPLAAAMTEKPVIGGSAWPNIILKNRGQECAFALWSNSTLGLLMYWWWSNRQQSGRGNISPSRLPTMPCLDLTRLSAKQLAAARRGFDSVKQKKLLPFYRANEDETRAQLDKIILTDVLELPKTVLDGVAIVREKLCREPSVRGGK